MESKIVPVSKLEELRKWRAEFHIHSERKLKSSKYDLFPLLEIVSVPKLAVEPRHYDENEFFYIGLENVEPISGVPINVEKVTSENIKSRSKIFHEGDILFGRLRPYLKKALLVEPPFKRGLCSTEFIVLSVNADIIHPLLLREILVSEEFISIVSSMQSGAALPRVSPKDLLKIEIPVPPIEDQISLQSEIQESRNQRLKFLREAEALSMRGQQIIGNILT